MIADAKSLAAAIMGEGWAMTDTIESIGAELDAAELAAHGKIEGPSWPATLAEWVRNRTPLDRVAFLPYMLPFRERIRALLDATRKPRKSRAQLARKCNRLRAKVIAARMERDAAVKRYERAEAHVRDCDARADRDREDWLALHAKYEAAMGVVEAVRAWNAAWARIYGSDEPGMAELRAVAKALEVFDSRGTTAGGGEDAKPVDTLESLAREFAGESQFAECCEWLKALVTAERMPTSQEIIHECAMSDFQELCARTLAWISAERAKRATPSLYTSTCPFAGDACAGGDPRTKPENVGTWSEERYHGARQWRCDCDEGSGNLRVHGALRCGGCGYARPAAKGGA